jgi:hypothetical protein
LIWRSFEGSRDDRPLSGYDASPISGYPYTTSLDATAANEAWYAKTLSRSALLTFRVKAKALSFVGGQDASVTLTEGGGVPRTITYAPGFLLWRVIGTFE